MKAKDQGRVAVAHYNFAQSSKGPFPIQLIHNSEHSDSPLRSQHHPTHTCLVDFSATNALPVPKKQYRAAHHAIDGLSMHNRLQTYL